jgi:hypothetical protein
MLAFFLGLGIGILHWRLFLSGLAKLQEPTSSGEVRPHLKRASVALSSMRMLFTTLLLVVAVHLRVTPTPLLGGLLCSCLGFRILAYGRSTKV